jgi:lipopolysaccharide biosynthesis regulator YciM
MPTESTFLLAGLFLLLAAAGWAMGRFGERDEEQPPAPLNIDYLKGLNFLLNEQTDQALEHFLEMVRVDDKTIETHFALGSLFRRRGEVDRAIRIHQNIIARPDLAAEQRDQALYSLAKDYLHAGLLDRAENLFARLSHGSR